jgi:hypothetical protein
MSSQDLSAGSAYMPGSNFEYAKNSKLPLESYRLNVDTNPTVISRPTPSIEQTKNINFRLLKAPPQHAGAIVVHQEQDVQLPAAPPLHIQQRAKSPAPLPPQIIRERPPPIAPPLPEKHITVPGKILAPPDRQVIVERFAPMPPSPQEVTVEQWLESDPGTRNVVYRPAPPTPLAPNPKNVLIQWERPEVLVRDKFNFLGVKSVNPHIYASHFGQSLVDGSRIPPVPLPNGARLARESMGRKVPVLTGDVGALRGLDLDCYGLGEYKDQVYGGIGRPRVS